MRDALKFRIPDFHSRGQVRIQRKKQRASKCWHTYSSCLATRRLRNQTVITHTQKRPSKFTKTTLKTGLCCADMRDDWIFICFLSRQIAPCHFCCWLWWSSLHCISSVSENWRRQTNEREKFTEINLSWHLSSSFLLLSCFFFFFFLTR